ncbi:hypothetical protein [Pseudomonas aeruginosa]|uniref:hypothetical protein n=1 Tax=Pseudomonas aeruginosa TaxID=287 RepID=UPI0034E0887B
MTELLTSAAVILCALLALSFTKPIHCLIPGSPRAYQQTILRLLVWVLVAFSLLETIRETGLIYGLLFSLIPLFAGAVVIHVSGGKGSAAKPHGQA